MKKNIQERPSEFLFVMRWVFSIILYFIISFYVALDVGIGRNENSLAPVAWLFLGNIGVSSLIVSIIFILAWKNFREKQKNFDLEHPKLAKKTAAADPPTAQVIGVMLVVSSVAIVVYTLITN